MCVISIYFFILSSICCRGSMCATQMKQKKTESLELPTIVITQQLFKVRKNKTEESNKQKNLPEYKVKQKQ